MLSIGREHGIADGFTVPRHLPSHVSAACTFAVGPGTRLPVDLLAVAEGVGAVALTTAKRIAGIAPPRAKAVLSDRQRDCVLRSEEHTSELQSLMRTSYAVFCLKKKTEHRTHIHKHESRQVTSCKRTPTTDTQTRRTSEEN